MYLKVLRSSNSCMRPREVTANDIVGTCSWSPCMHVPGYGLPVPLPVDGSTRLTKHSRQWNNKHLRKIERNPTFRSPIILYANRHKQPRISKFGQRSNRGLTLFGKKNLDLSVITDRSNHIVFLPHSWRCPLCPSGGSSKLLRMPSVSLFLILFYEARQPR